MKKWIIRMATAVVCTVLVASGFWLMADTQPAFAAKTVKAKSITLNKSKTVTLLKGNTLSVKATLKPKNTTQKKIEWTSSNKKVATVSSSTTTAKNGQSTIKVKGIKTGTVTIKAKIKGTSKTDSFKVKVVTPVSSVKFQFKTRLIETGGKINANAFVAPSSAYNKGLTYTSSNTKVATVSSSGIIKGVKAGAATITAKAKDGSGKKAEMRVTVVEPVVADMRVGMVADGDTVEDGAINQEVFEACSAFVGSGDDVAKSYSASFDDPLYAVEDVIKAGANVLILPGFTFCEAIYEVSQAFPDVKFIGIDMTEDDITSYGKVTANNINTSAYNKEVAGYMAGYAAVSLGYTKLGFLGGIPISDILRYGYGFVQGADDAAAEKNIDGVELIFTHAGQFFPSDELTNAVNDKMYAKGTQVVFSSGGGIWGSVGAAAMQADGRMIGVDVDLGPQVKDIFGADLAITSAIMDIDKTVTSHLDSIKNGKWDEVKGYHRYNWVGLPYPDSTQWGPGFQKEDYEALRSELYNGTRTVSDETDKSPEVKKIQVDYKRSIFDE